MSGPLTRAQKRILKEVEGGRKKAFDGRSWPAIKALAEAGLVTYERFRGYGVTGSDYYFVRLK